MRLTRIILNALLLGALAGIAVFPQPAVSGHQQPKPPEGNEEWAPGTFHGIRVGKSTSEDVIRTFGKPDGKGEVKELVEPSDKEGLKELGVPFDEEGVIEYGYFTAPGVDCFMEIIVGKGSGVVSAILLLPEEMTRADAIKKFGADFEKSNTKLGPCPTARERELFAREHTEYYELLVYRKLGLYVGIGDVKKDDTVMVIVYLGSCRQEEKTPVLPGLRSWAIVDRPSGTGRLEACAPSRALNSLTPSPGREVDVRTGPQVRQRRTTSTGNAPDAAGPSISARFALSYTGFEITAS